MGKIKEIDVLIFSGSGKPEPEETYKTFREGKEDIDLGEPERPSLPETEGGEKETQKEEKEGEEE